MTSLWTPKRIAALRKSFDLTQEEFARRLGVTFVTVSRWENGHGAPKGLSLKALDLCQAEAAARKKPS
jgi:DNA-binding transcriptional regulator YiaG